MKKQIISLLVGASLFATGSAFAMQNSDEDNQEKKPLSIKWSISNEQQLAGEGNFQALVNNGNKKVAFGIIVDFLSLKDIFSLFQCSKGMYNWMNSDYSWKIIAKNYGYVLNTLLSSETSNNEAKEYVKDSALFSNIDVPYKVTIEQLLSFMEKESPTFMGKEASKAYVFSIGKRCFEMRNDQVGSHHLEKLPQDAFVSFTKTICQYDPNKGNNIELYDLKALGFGASVSISKSMDYSEWQVKNLHSTEYEKLMNQELFKPMWAICNNSFSIKQREDKEENHK